MEFFLVAQNEFRDVLQIAVFSKRPVGFEFSFFQTADAFAELEEVAGFREFADAVDLTYGEDVVAVAAEVVRGLAEIFGTQFAERFADAVGVAVRRWIFPLDLRLGNRSSLSDYPFVATYPSDKFFMFAFMKTSIVSEYSS